MRPSPKSTTRRRRRPRRSGTESDPLVMLLEALLGHNASRHRVLTERGGHAAYLVVSLLGSPGPVVTAPALRPQLLGAFVPVELEAFLWRGEVGPYFAVEGQRSVVRRTHPSSPFRAERPSSRTPTLALDRSRAFIVFMNRLRSSSPLSLSSGSRIWPAPFSGSTASTRVRPSSS